MNKYNTPVMTIIIKEDMPTCLNCKKWYKNSNGGHDCVWNNNTVPKKDDFCSRWEKALK